MWREKQIHWNYPLRTMNIHKTLKLVSGAGPYLNRVTSGTSHNTHQTHSFRAPPSHPIPFCLSFPLLSVGSRYHAQVLQRILYRSFSKHSRRGVIGQESSRHTRLLNLNIALCENLCIKQADGGRNPHSCLRWEEWLSIEWVHHFIIILRYTLVTFKLNWHEPPFKPTGTPKRGWSI